MPQAVPQGAQVGLAGAFVFTQGCGDLCDGCAALSETGDDLCGKLHARALEIQRKGGISVKCPQAAVEVLHMGVEPPPAQCRQQRHAPFVAPWHGSRRNAAGKPISHHQRRTAAQPLHKTVGVGKIVTAVAVAHDNVLAMRGLYAADEGSSVAPLVHMDNPGTAVLRYLHGSIHRPVVRNENLFTVSPKSDCTIQINFSLIPVPETLEEQLAEASKLENKTYLPYITTIEGKVSEIADPYNAQHKNITFYVNVNGTEVYCYRVKGEGMETLAVGDTVKVVGNLTAYNHNPQFDSKATVTITEKAVQPEEPDVPDVPVVPEGEAVVLNFSGKENRVPTAPPSRSGQKTASP